LLPRPGSITFTAFSSRAMLPVKAASKSGAAVPTIRSPRPSWIKIAAAPASIVTTRFGGEDSLGSGGQSGAALMFIPPLPDDDIPDIAEFVGDADPMFIPAIDDDFAGDAGGCGADEQAARAAASAADETMKATSREIFSRRIMLRYYKPPDSLWQ